MSTIVYKIGRTLLIPLAIDVFLLFILLSISLFVSSSPTERIVLFVLFIPLLYIFLESISRKVIIENNGIEIKKLFRNKVLGWKDITSVGTVIIQKKAYILLTTTKGFQTLSNSYENFTALVQNIVDNVDTDKVEEDVQTLIEYPIKKISNIIAAWVVVIILLGTIYIKLTHL